MPDAPKPQGTIFETLKNFFQEDDWPTQAMENKHVLRMGFKGENGSWLCFAQAIEEQQKFVFYSTLETTVPVRKIPAVAEFLARANYGLLLGNFEIDFADGEVRYRTSIDIEGGELTLQMIRKLVYVNVLMMDKYLPGIMGVAHSDLSPQEALEKIES